MGHSVWYRVLNTFDEMIQQERDIVVSFAKRGHLKMNDVQPVVEILAKRFRGNTLDQHPVGSGDDTHVDPGLGGFVRTHTLNLSGLQEPEQQTLHPRRGLPNFVHEDRATICGLEDSGPVAIRAREAAAHVAEQLGFEQGFRESCAIDRDQRRPAARSCSHE